MEVANGRGGRLRWRAALLNFSIVICYPQPAVARARPYRQSETEAISFRCI
jgi:hypothetical protein